MSSQIAGNGDALCVSILMITYNQEKYIAEAIEGVLMQQTNFPFELIICNDGSIDNTGSIIEGYLDNQLEHKIIRYFNHKHNLGMMGNFIFGLNQCKRKYVAFCEGEWDPLESTCRHASLSIL